MIKKVSYKLVSDMMIPRQNIGNNAQDTLAILGVNEDVTINSERGDQPRNHFVNCIFLTADVREMCLPNSASIVLESQTEMVIFNMPFDCANPDADSPIHKIQDIVRHFPCNIPW